jgi:hypothetical protein
MQEETPRLVRIAVRMAIIVWMMNFQVSFFIVVFVLRVHSFSPLSLPLRGRFGRG